MADKKQVRLLKKDVSKWNKWRFNNPKEKIDLSGVNLVELDLRKADLSGANLREANLTGVDLREANLHHANLSNANLLVSDLSKATLIWAKLSGAKLRKAKLIKAKLSESKLCEADLCEADLTGAYLSGADITGTIFYNTFFSSRSQLILLKYKLTEAQEAGSIFIDEREETKKKRKSQTPQTFPYLRIVFSEDIPWKNEWFAFWLLSFQVTYNNLYYLCTTNENNIEKIKAVLQRGHKVSAMEDIEIKIIQKKSPLIMEFIQFASEFSPQVAYVLATMSGILLASSKAYKFFMEAEETRAKKQLLKEEINEKQFILAVKKEEYVAKKLTEHMENELKNIKIPSSNDVILVNRSSLLSLALRKHQVIQHVLSETVGSLNVKAEFIENDEKQEKT